MKMVFGSATSAPATDAIRGSRVAHFEKPSRLADAPAFWSKKMPAGAEIFGPALIDNTTTTIVVFPGQRLLANGRESFLWRSR